MDDLTCPRCKTTKYRNPSLKLLVNNCGHALCDSCVELLFVKGSGNCPECGIPLRRSAFRVQLFEDPAVEKEVEIRRRVLKDFSKQEDDFPSLREFNDYLEEVERIVFNLANNIDIIETNKLIEQYKKDNKEQIAKARHRKNQEILLLEAIIEQETHRSEYRRLESMNLEKEEKLRKLKNREALIDDLMFLESDAKSIVEQHKAQAQETAAGAGDSKPITSATTGALGSTLSYQAPSLPQAGGTTTMFTSGIGIGIGGGGSSTTFLPVPKAEEVPLFVYQPQEVEIGGPKLPTREELLKESSNPASYLSHIRAASGGEIAGGYHHVLACRRALQDAFMDIAMQPKLLAASAPKMEIMDTS